MLQQVNHELGISKFTLNGFDSYRSHILEQLAHSESRILNSVQHLDARPDNVTWYSNHYNIFTVLGSSKFAWQLWRDVESCIREHIALHDVHTQEGVWFRSWLNRHTTTQRLQSHRHDWPLHGYISLEPQNSRTVFTHEENGAELYSIHNTPGTVYIGPGDRWHHVEYDSEFTGRRVTLGFDIETRDRIIEDDWSLFPIAV